MYWKMVLIQAVNVWAILPFAKEKTVLVKSQQPVYSILCIQSIITFDFIIFIFRPKCRELELHNFMVNIVNIVLTFVKAIIVVKSTTSMAVMLLPNESPVPA